MKNKIVLCAILILSVIQIQGKTKKIGTWIELEVTKDIFKKVEFSVKPEVRLQDDFSVDEYFIEGQITYKPVKYLRFAGAYRLAQNIKKKGTETFHRFAFDAHAKNEWKRLEGAFRIRYTNYAEFETVNEKSNYLRFRFKFEYDLKNSKFKPYTSYELFHNLTEKTTNKGRFDMGATYKLSDISRVGIYYRLQSVFGDKKSINILGLSYRLSL
jgi:hypothetical protein